MSSSDFEQLRNARRAAIDLASRGQSFAEVEKGLRADGYDNTTVAKIMPIVINELAEAYRNQARRLLGFGGLILVVGLVITTLSFMGQANTGFVVITGGAIVVGATLLWRGSNYLRRASRVEAERQTLDATAGRG